MTKTIFNRNNAEVQTDAVSLSLEDFQVKYKDQTTAIILKTVWNSANKNKATTAQVASKTTKSNDLPGKTEPITNVAVSDEALPKEIVKEDSFEASDGSTVSIAQSEDGKKVIVSVDSTGVEENETSTVSGEEKSTKKGKKEKTSTAQKTAVTSPEGKPTRATRLRELIAEKKDKKAATEILKAEGYDCTTIHSEWNRLNK